jgi:hypothetical protein
MYETSFVQRIFQFYLCSCIASVLFQSVYILLLNKPSVSTRDSPGASMSVMTKAEKDLKELYAKT